MKNNLLVFTLTSFCFFTGYSQSLYTSTVQTGNRFNPGLGASGRPIVLFDDVLIPSTQVQGSDSVSITIVKFAIRRLAAAPAVTVNFYYAVTNEDFTGYDDLISIPPVLIGSVNLPVKGADPVTTLVSFGDSVNTLFKVKTDTGYLYTNYQTLFLGLDFSTVDADQSNGWRITTPGSPASDNDDFMWFYDLDDPQLRYASAFSGESAPSATFYLEAFGYGSKTLPVTLTTFAAHRTNGVNVLNWTT